MITTFNAHGGQTGFHLTAGNFATSVKVNGSTVAYTVTLGRVALGTPLSQGDVVTVTQYDVTSGTRATGLARSPGFQGLQIFGGRTATQTTAGLAYELAMELPARSPYAVGSLGVIFGQSAAASTPATLSVSADVKFASSVASLDGAWTGSGIKTQTFANQLDTAARVPFPVIGVGQTTFPIQRRCHLFGDMVECVPVDRVDGGTKPLAVARCGTSSGNVALIGSAGDDFTPWASRAAGLVRFRANSGSDRTVTTGWSNASTGPMVGFTYAHTGPILNVLSIGDSQSESRSEDYLNLNWVQRACETINAGNPKTWLSHSNLAWAGQGTDAFVQHFIDLIEQGLIPDIVVLQVGTVNDTAGNVALTAAVVNTWRARFARLLSLCTANRITPFVWTLPPANYATRNYGASDALRVAYNEEMKALCDQIGIPILDAASLVSGGLDGNSQQTILPAFNLDNIHLNALGQTTLATAAVPLLQRLLGDSL